jgi:hypothetical protein
VLLRGMHLLLHLLLLHLLLLLLLWLFGTLDYCVFFV